MTTPQDLDACSPPQMAVLYHKARMAFQNVSGSEYFTRIKPFLGEPGEDTGRMMPEAPPSVGSPLVA